MVEQLWKVYGPVFLSVLAFCLSFCILQPIALFIDPSYNLLANRGVGKFALMTMALVQLFLFSATCSKKVRQKIYQAALFFTEKKSLIYISSYFGIFFAAHVLIIAFFIYTQYIFFTPILITKIGSLALRILLGLGVTLLLAWSEELIFRGVLGNYFYAYLTPLSTVLVTSYAFMLVHNLSAPWQLMMSQWRLGLGLFLLGCLFHLIYLRTQRISASMGAHMGLVMVKVLLRRLPCLTYIDSSQWGYIMHSDLRQSGLVHLLLCITVVLLYIDIKTKQKSRFSSYSQKILP